MMRDTDRKQRLYPTTVRVLKVLADGEPRSRRQIAAAVPCSVDSADNAVAFWRDIGLVHVARWQRQRGTPTAYYTFGPGADAALPPPKSAAERSRAWRDGGGDHHRARTLARQQKLIAQSATVAGLARLTHRRTSTDRKERLSRETTAPVAPMEAAA
jgi:hypothetical protein